MVIGTPRQACRKRRACRLLAVLLIPVACSFARNFECVVLGTCLFLKRMFLVKGAGSRSVRLGPEERGSMDHRGSLSPTRVLPVLLPWCHRKLQGVGQACEAAVSQALP